MKKVIQAISLLYAVNEEKCVGQLVYFSQWSTKSHSEMRWIHDSWSITRNKWDGTLVFKSQIVSRLIRALKDIYW